MEISNLKSCYEQLAHSCTLINKELGRDCDKATHKKYNKELVAIHKVMTPLSALILHYKEQDEE